jgi:WD40 repeat protein
VQNLPALLIAGALIFPLPLFAQADTVAKADRTIPLPAAPGRIFFSADGKFLVTNCRDGRLRKVEVASGKLTQALDHRGANLVSADRFLLKDKAGAIGTWDLTADRQTHLLYSGRSDSAAVSSDGDFAAFADAQDRQLRIVQVQKSAKVVHTLPDGVGGTAALSFSPDGQILVAANYDNDVRIFKTRSGELVRKIDDLTGAMFAVGFTSGGEELVMAGLDHTVYVLDGKTFQVKREMEGHRQTISALALSPDGRTLVTGGFDVATVANPVQVAIWDYANGKILRTVRSPHRVISLAISPDSRWLAMTSGDSEISLWRLGQ